MLASLSVDALKPIAEELDRWPGGETLVNIPVRARPLLAEVFAAVLNAMVDGSVVTGTLLRCLPKLLLHRAALRFATVGDIAKIVRSRCVLLLGGKVVDLCVRVRQERAAPPRLAGRRPRPSAAPSVVPTVRALARAGAFSKAVKRFSSSIAVYDHTTAYSWAPALSPTLLPTPRR
jgi:hypothetical protein